MNWVSKPSAFIDSVVRAPEQHLGSNPSWILTFIFFKCDIPQCYSMFFLLPVFRVQEIYSENTLSRVLQQTCGPQGVQ